MIAVGPASQQYSSTDLLNYQLINLTAEVFMAVFVDAVIRKLGLVYTDGTPNMEIHVSMKKAEGLPLRIGERVPIRLQIDGIEYQAGLRATQRNKYAWVCPNMYEPGNEPTKLGRVLLEAGFQANDRVQLQVEGDSLTVRRA